jgi:phosphoacetylglucosamine mutase
MINEGGDSARLYGTEEGYYRMLAEAYRAILQVPRLPCLLVRCPPCSQIQHTPFVWMQGVDPAPAARGPLIVDAAHGVGGPKLKRLAAVMADCVTIEVRNNVDERGELNYRVGAEHVQKTRTPPLGVDPSVDRTQRLASVDGDADRLVYHYFDEDGSWHLLDGDAIAALAAMFFSEQLRILGIPVTSKPANDGHGHDDAASSETYLASVSVGVVQTAYANGASTNYIKNKLRMPVPLAKTGVKFVHHEAAKYDLGVYFEANGHGTILFSPRLLRYLNALGKEALSEKARVALNRVLAAAKLINQAVGDAISDAMFIEAVLTLKGWTVKDWSGMYTDLPRYSRCALTRPLDENMSDLLFVY